MIEQLRTFIHTPVGQGVVSGFLAAAAVDYHAFREWKDFNDVATYGWSKAAFRWVQGIVIGGLTGLGLGNL